MPQRFQGRFDRATSRVRISEVVPRARQVLAVEQAHDLEIEDIEVETSNYQRQWVMGTLQRLKS